MSNFTSVPATMNESETGTKYVTGKITLVCPQLGLTVIGVSGGQNPGQYVINTGIAGALETALAALENQNEIWSVIDPNGQLLPLAIYAK